MYRRKLTSLSFVCLFSTTIVGWAFGVEQLVSTSISAAAKDKIDPNVDFMIAEESRTSGNYQRTVKPIISTSYSGPKLSDDDGDIFLKQSSQEYWHKEEMPSMYHGNAYSSDPYMNMNHISDNGYGSAGHEYMSFNQGYLNGKDIDVMPKHKPITLHYRTHAQPIVVHQMRLPGPKPEVKHTKSQEEPQRVVHEVIRPIIQEVHEIIQPYRRVVQQVQPVIEEVRTVIAKDSGKSNGGGGGGGNGAGSAGGSGYAASYGPVSSSAYSQAGASPYSGHVVSYTPYAGSSGAGGHALGGQYASASTLNKYKQLYKKALLANDDDNMLTMSNNQRLTRSRVYLTPKGIPVYQSNYRPPIYLS